MAKLNFKQPLLKYIVSYDYSEINLMNQFGSQETFLIFSMLKTVFAAKYLMEAVIHYHLNICGM